MSQFEGMLVSVARKPTAPPPPTAGKRGRDQVDSALDRILLDDDALDQGGRALAGKDHLGGAADRFGGQGPGDVGWKPHPHSAVAERIDDERDEGGT